MLVNLYHFSFGVVGRRFGGGRICGYSWRLMNVNFGTCSEYSFGYCSLVDFRDGILVPVNNPGHEYFVDGYSVRDEDPAARELCMRTGISKSIHVTVHPDSSTLEGTVNLAEDESSLSSARGLDHSNASAVIVFIPFVQIFNIDHIWNDGNVDLKKMGYYVGRDSQKTGLDEAGVKFLNFSGTSMALLITRPGEYVLKRIDDEAEAASMRKFCRWPELYQPPQRYIRFRISDTYGTVGVGGG